MSTSSKQIPALQSMNMQGNEKGEIILPSEQGMINFAGTLHQFIVLATRLTSFSSLDFFSKSEPISVRNLTYIPPELTPIKSTVPYVGLVLKVLPTDCSLAEFAKNEGEFFFKFLIDITGFSNFNNHQGHRCAFIQNFHEISTVEYGNILEAKILLGTSIFYDDYKVKTNFPNSYEILFDICKDIYSKILNKYPSLEIEINTYTLENDISNNNDLKST
jgi:hypothetical protein